MAVLRDEGSMNTKFLRGQHLQLVTGKLAAESLREAVAPLAQELEFSYTIDVMPITVAALMTIPWIARHIEHNPAATRVVLPGYCQGEIAPLQAQLGIPIEVGPKELRHLASFLGGTNTPITLEQYDIQILAEINHAPRWSLPDFITMARRLAADGADWIDVGCDPSVAPWSGVGEYVRALRDEGLRVSIDSFDVTEIEHAVAAGAELVLSVNSRNRQAAVDWGVEVIAIPDEPHDLSTLHATYQKLLSDGVRTRLDPILEPIGFGFFRSLQRYATVREVYPDAEMMMGIGNLTELTDVDSAGINLLLISICQELGIRSILTTQVIPWAQTSVRECNIARRIAYHAVQSRHLPKHLCTDLVMLRDADLPSVDLAFLQRMADELRDLNLRIFASREATHLVTKGICLSNSDPFLLFDELRRVLPRELTPSHAFYLGYELSKATIARTLGKPYTQDEALKWGMLTVEESSHRLKRET